jgi:hypothetical protein
MFIARAGPEVLHSVRSVMCVLNQKIYLTLSDLDCPILKINMAPLTERTNS